MNLTRQDYVILSTLGLCVLISAISLPVNPWPVDYWFFTQITLVGDFDGADNYSPVAAPAVLFKLAHWIAALLSFDLRDEMYTASVLQNFLIFLGAVFTYMTGRLLTGRLLAGFVVIVYTIFVLSTGVAQAFWSESVVFFLFAWVLFLSIRLRLSLSTGETRFWWTSALIGFLIGVLAATRVVPALLIPGLVILLARQMTLKRLAGLLMIVTTMTGIVMIGLMVSNYARFGRFELTNSGGRHLWQGVSPIVEQALGGSPEFERLEELNSGILQGKYHYEIEVPVDRMSPPSGVLRGHFDRDDLQTLLAREEILGRLAKEAILNEPMLYLRKGLSNFSRTILVAPFRMGFYDRGGHPNPLETDGMLPPLIEDWRGLPRAAGQAAAVASKGIYWTSRGLFYGVSILFLLVTYAALLLDWLRSRAGGQSVGGGAMAAALALTGILLVLALQHWVSGIDRIAAQNSDLVTGASRMFQEILGLRIEIVGLLAALDFVVVFTSVAVIAVQALIVYRDPGGGSGGAEALGIYSFLAFIFFCSMWLSWQVEVANSRNALPYVPFLALMMCMALSYWIKVARRVLGMSSVQGTSVEHA